MELERTEKLKIPKYENFNRVCFYSITHSLIKFYSTTNYFEQGNLIIKEFGDYIDEDGKILFQRLDTKNNYEEAIKFCKILFLGE